MQSPKEQNTFNLQRITNCKPERETEGGNAFGESPRAAVGEGTGHQREQGQAPL